MEQRNSTIARRAYGYKLLVLFGFICLDGLGLSALLNKRYSTACLYAIENNIIEREKIMVLKQGGITPGAKSLSSRIASRIQVMYRPSLKCGWLIYYNRREVEGISIDADSFINFGGKKMRNVYSAYPYFISEMRWKGLRVI